MTTVIVFVIVTELVLVLLSFAIIAQNKKANAVMKDVLDELKRSRALEAKKRQREDFVHEKIIEAIKAMEVEVLKMYTPGDYQSGIYKGMEESIKAVKFVVGINRRGK